MTYELKTHKAIHDKNSLEVLQALDIFEIKRSINQSIVRTYKVIVDRHIVLLVELLLLCKQSILANKAYNDAFNDASLSDLGVTKEDNPFHDLEAC